MVLTQAHTPWGHDLWDFDGFLVHLCVWEHFDNHARLHKGKWMISLY